MYFSRNHNTSIEVTKMDNSKQGNRIKSLMRVSDSLSRPGQLIRLAKDGFYYDGEKVLCFDCKVSLDLAQDITNHEKAHHGFCLRELNDKPLASKLPPGFLACEMPMKNIHG